MDINANRHTTRALLGVASMAAAALVAGCAAPPPEGARPPSSASAPILPPPSARSPAPAVTAPSATAARTLSEWKRSAAERIQSTNRALVYGGRPPNPLRAVVVVEMTVAADGRVRRADLLRVPGHSRELGTVALRSLDSASPLPPPPRALVAHGPMKVTETWLFREDGHFQIRTLAMAQVLE
jgi:protein TonB